MKRAALPSESRVVVPYRRVSTDKQANRGVSLEQQDTMADAWAEQRGHFITERFSDPGISGKKLRNRAGVQAALKAACETKGILLVYSLSRLCRNVEELIQVARILRKAGADLVSITQPMDTTTTQGRLIFNILAAVDEFTADWTGDHVREIMAYKKQQRLKYGETPFGYRVLENPTCPKHTSDPERACSCTLIEDDVEQGILADVRSARAADSSWPEIASLLNGRGVRTKKGRLWVAQNLRKLALPHMAQVDFKG